MSLTIIQHDPEARVRIGGENDHDGARGRVVLEVDPPTAQLRPAIARQVAAKLVQFAAAAVPGSAENVAASHAARVLGAGSASKAGKASQSKRSPEERKERAQKAIRARWEQYRAKKGDGHAKAGELDKPSE